MHMLLFAMGLAVGPGPVRQPVSAAAQSPEAEEQGSTWPAGVYVSVEADMWKGPKLKDVIPLFVTIENKSRTPCACATRSSGSCRRGSGSNGPAPVADPRSRSRRHERRCGGPFAGNR
jgi:hypothetical protein